MNTGGFAVYGLLLAAFGFTYRELATDFVGKSALTSFTSALLVAE